MTNKPFGWSLQLDLYECNRIKITKKKYIKKYIKELLKLIDMKPYKRPIIKRFGNNELEGISALQFLYTSNLAIHCDEYNVNNIHIDLFSCKVYDPQIVYQFSKDFFEAKYHDLHYRER